MTWDYQTRCQNTSTIDGTYICGKCKPERDIAAHVHTGMLFLVPSSLRQPEPHSAFPGDIFAQISRLSQGPTFEILDRIIVAFEKAVPRPTKRVDDDESNHRGNGDAGISQGEEQIGGRSHKGAE
jgi:hypothetical protein